MVPLINKMMMWKIRVIFLWKGINVKTSEEVPMRINDVLTSSEPNVSKKLGFYYNSEWL